MVEEDTKFSTFHKAAEASNKDQAVVSLGMGDGYKVIPQERW